MAKGYKDLLAQKVFEPPATGFFQWSVDENKCSFLITRFIFWMTVESLLK